MDMPDTDKNKLLDELSEKLNGTFFDYSEPDYESIAMCDERLLEKYLDSGKLTKEDIKGAIGKCLVYPCWFGAALKLDGVDEFLTGLLENAPVSRERPSFGAKVYKITHDEQGAKITHMKITGGELLPRDTIKGDGWEAKVTQIRSYSGAKFTPLTRALPGDIVALPGLDNTSVGMGLGSEPDGEIPSLEPVLTYSVIFPEGTDVHRAINDLKRLEEEDPQLNLVWDERLQSLRVQLMGPVQLEILSDLVKERYGLCITFGKGQIIYRETIRAAAPLCGGTPSS
jgi:translation elongation factor EF-G